MQENADHNNSEYGHFLRSEISDTHQILLHRGIDDIAIQDNKGIGFELKNCLRHFKTGSSEKYTHQR